MKEGENYIKESKGKIKDNTSIFPSPNSNRRSIVNTYKDPLENTGTHFADALLNQIEYHK